MDERFKFKKGDKIVDKFKPMGVWTIERRLIDADTDQPVYQIGDGVPGSNCHRSYCFADGIEHSYKKVD